MLNARLWRHGPFVRFFMGAGLSIVGDWFNTVAIAVLIYQLTGRVALVAVAFIASVLPRVALAPIGGALADRFERRNLLIALDASRAVVALLPLFAHSAGMVWCAYGAVLLLQAGACVYNPTQGAYLSHLVPDDLLEPANASFATMRDSAMVVGPALAAAVLGVWGSAVAFGANALSFAVSAGLLLTLPHAIHGATQALQVRTFVTAHAAIVRRYPRIAALYLCYLVAVVPLYFFQTIMVVYARDLGQPTSFVGMFYAAAGLGGALGGLIMGHYLRRLPYTVVISLYALGVPALGALAFVHNVGLALAFLAGRAAAGTTGDLIVTVSVQRYVAPEQRGRAFGLWFWCIAIGQLVGACMGVTVTVHTAMSVLLWCSLVILPIILIGMLVSIRAGHPPNVTVQGTVAQSVR